MIVSEQVNSALCVAIEALSEVAREGTASDRIAASKVLLDAVTIAHTQLRRDEILSRTMPLLDVISKNLSGLLDEGTTWSPVLALDPAAQSSIVMSLTKEITG